MKDYAKRICRASAGSLLCALGSVLVVKAGIGLAPWEAFFMGVSHRTGIIYGDAVLWGGILILGLDVWMKEKIGLGSLISAVLCGVGAKIFMQIRIPLWLTGWGGSVALLLAGSLIQSLGICLHMKAALGCGPKDALMVGLGRRFSRAPLGAVRIVLEGTVLALGWQMGAGVGAGTLISVLANGVFLDAVFGVFHFRASEVCHEGFRDTCRNIQRKACGKNLGRAQDSRTI